jgi:dihydropyrimidine dehydrogenase (NAD+) subunit PreA
MAVDIFQSQEVFGMDEHATDLSVEFCGLRFPNPFVLASCPITDTADKVLRAFRAGWGGAILKTISMTPKRHTQVTPRFGRLLYEGRVIGFTNMEISSPHTLDWWKETVRKIKEEFPDRPLFASIIRTEDRTERDWIEATEAFQEAGVDGIELNFSCSHAFHKKGGGASIGKDPKVTKLIAGWVMSKARVPVIAKLTMATSDIGKIAKAAVKAGVQGITAINSVPGVEGIDLETMIPRPAVDGCSSFTGLSGPAIRPIGLRAVGEVRRAVSVAIMGCGGIWNWRDAIQYLAMGASTVQVCTAVMFRGFDIIKGLTEGLSGYLVEKKLSGVTDLIGQSFSKYVDHGALSREYRVVAWIDPDKCKKCKLCHFACRDAANDAIILSDEGVASVVPDRCIGCGLCQQVCVQPECIRMKRV